MIKLSLLLTLSASLCLAQHPSGEAVYRSIPVEAGEKDADSDLENIRQNVRQDLLITKINEEVVSRLVSTFSSESTWPGIDYQNVSRTGFEHRIHLSNILQLAQAYQEKDSKFYHSKQVGSVVEKALRFWAKHDFICDNWWWNEMGTPNLMISILLTIDEDLPADLKAPLLRIAGRANMEASGARPGGDLIQIAGMRGKQALYQRNATELKAIVDIMAAEIKTTTGRGMKPDLSFHHRTDNVISTHTYGTGYTNAFAYWTVKTKGTRYELPERALQLLVDHFVEGINASTAFGKYPDPGAKNRELSRKNALAASGPELAVNLRKSTDYRSSELNEIIKVRKGEKAMIPSASHFYWHSEYFTFQRPGYFASVRMHSSRNHNMEYPHNEEGLKNHHFADGSNFLIRSGQEYHDIFPVWDWQKIPGTTIVQKPALPNWSEIAKKGKREFTGGVTDGRYGAAAFDFESVHDPLRARKSWFFFDNEYVCLGSGIRSEAAYPVVTTLDQRHLNGPVSIINANKKIQALKPGAHTLPGTEGVVHDGVAYFFLGPETIHLKNQTESGTWKSISHQSWASETPEEQDVFTLWIDHGQQPKGASYAYRVMPNFGHDLKLAGKPNSQISVLSNSESMQAVWDSRQQLCQAVFYEPGKLSLPNGETIEAQTPCMLLIEFKKKRIKSISAADPSRKLQSVKLVTSSAARGRVTGDKVKVQTNLPHTSWEISLPQEEMAGQSTTATF